MAVCTRVCDVEVFQGALKGKAVDHRRQHPHVIGGGSVHSAGTGIDPAEDVPATDNDAELYAEVDDIPDLRGDRIHDLRIDSEGTLSHEGFAAQFEQHPPVLQADP